MGDQVTQVLKVSKEVKDLQCKNSNHRGLEGECDNVIVVKRAESTQMSQ